MARAFFTLQGKGGVGKSFASSVLTQYLMEAGYPVRAFDTDPVNQTLAKYGPLGAVHIKLSEPDNPNAIIKRHFDQLVEDIAESGPDDVIVVDNGSSNFLPLMDYLLENDVPGLLEGEGHEFIINAVVAGGPDLTETLRGLKGMMDATPSPALVWVNAYLGETTYKGKPVQETLRKAHGDRLRGLVAFARLEASTLGRDNEEMLSDRLTFDEATAQYKLVVRSRIKRTKQALWAQLDEVFAEAGADA